MYNIKQTLLLLVIASSTMAVKLQQRKPNGTYAQTEANSDSQMDWAWFDEVTDGKAYAQTEADSGAHMDWAKLCEQSGRFCHMYAQTEADSDAQMDWAWFDEVTGGKAYAQTEAESNAQTDEGNALHLGF